MLENNDIYELINGNPVKGPNLIMKSHSNNINQFAINYQGEPNIVATVSTDKTIKFWDIETRVAR